MTVHPVLVCSKHTGGVIYCKLAKHLHLKAEAVDICWSANLLTLLCLLLHLFNVPYKEHGFHRSLSNHNP